MRPRDWNQAPLVVTCVQMPELLALCVLTFTVVIQPTKISSSPETQKMERCSSLLSSVVTPGTRSSSQLMVGAHLGPCHHCQCSLSSASFILCSQLSRLMSFCGLCCYHRRVHSV